MDRLLMENELLQGTLNTYVNTNEANLAQVEALKAENARLTLALQALDKQLTKALHTDLQAENERLRVALKPFANAGERYNTWKKNAVWAFDPIVWHIDEVRIARSDFMGAFEALQPAEVKQL